LFVMRFVSQSGILDNIEVYLLINTLAKLRGIEAGLSIMHTPQLRNRCKNLSH
jgi:hypothetical protein